MTPALSFYTNLTRLVIDSLVISAQSFIAISAIPASILYCLSLKTELLLHILASIHLADSDTRRFSMKLDKEDKSSQSNPISETNLVDDNYKNGFYKNPDFPYLPLMFEGCYEWCSVSRQKWPMPDSLFIDDLDYICVFEIPQYHPTHGNYLWLPTILRTSYLLCLQMTGRSQS